MKKQSLDFASVRALHQAGEFLQAEEGYLAILRKNPRKIAVLHSLGILYAQQENFSAATHYLQTAIKYAPHDPTLQLHLANVFKMQGLYANAAEILQETVRKNSDYVPAFNNLGAIYYAQGKLNEAVEFYRKTIVKQPNYIDAYYNIGLALAKQNETKEAV